MNCISSISLENEETKKYRIRSSSNKLIAHCPLVLFGSFHHFQATHTVLTVVLVTFIATCCVHLFDMRLTIQWHDSLWHFPTAKKAKCVQAFQTMLSACNNKDKLQMKQFRIDSVCVSADVQARNEQNENRFAERREMICVPNSHTKWQNNEIKLHFQFSMSAVSGCVFIRKRFEDEKKTHKPERKKNLFILCHSLWLSSRRF